QATPVAPPGRGMRGRARGRLRREGGSGRSPSRQESAPRGSTLAVLGRLAGLLETGLLALGHPRVAGEEAGLLQRRAVLDVRGLQRAGDAEAQRTGLAAGAAAVDPREHVELALQAEQHERLVHDLLVDLVREVLVQGPAVDLPLAGAGDDAHPGDGLLAAAGAGGGAGRDGLAQVALARGLGRLGAVLGRHVLVRVELLDARLGGLVHGSPWGVLAR